MPITPNGLDNFLKLFAGDAAVDEQQAEQYSDCDGCAYDCCCETA